MLNHNDECLNCLTTEQFKLLCETHKEGDEFPCECDECGNYNLGDHRCSCGNRRIAVYYSQPNKLHSGFFYCETY